MSPLYPILKKWLLGYKTILNFYQIGDSWFEGHERIRYTRDQLLRLHQVSRVFFILENSFLIACVLLYLLPLNVVQISIIIFVIVIVVVIIITLNVIYSFQGLVEFVCPSRMQ